jgi:hypothetical protein
MATDFANDTISSLPAITGDGLFPVKIVVPNVAPDTGLFAPTVGNPSTSYSHPLMDPAKLIGTASHPYMNIALPAYISTLYKNVYEINTKLTNDISTTAADDRTYPTSHAVQHYVQSQVSGTQILSGANNINLVNTTTTTTLIQTAASSAQNFEYAYDGPAIPISIYNMDEVGAGDDTSARNGAAKTVMFSANGYLRNADGTVTGQLAFLYSGDKANFYWLGQPYKFYQFVADGDFVDFIQSYDKTNSRWEWLVKHCLGVFTNNVILSTKTGGAATISRINNLTTPVPIGLDFK